jgi:hypothetical protein
MLGPFVAEKGFGDGAKLIVDQRRQGIQRFRLALLPTAEQLRNFSLRGALQPS